MKNRFGKLARDQQARFRRTLSLDARSPTDDKARRHGHLLALGYEHENLYPTLRGPEGALGFFARRGIKWWRSTRSGDQPGDGPTRNLASSQIACVNFLLPLAAIPNALTTLLRSIDPDVDDVVVMRDKAGNESCIEFEWVGWGEPLEGGAMTRGANQTSVDALAVAKVRRGLRAYLFEWKYCEEYLRPKHKGMGRAGDTRRKRYKALFENDDSSFNRQAPFDEFLYEPFYQIMRLRLLADKMLDQGVTPSISIEEAKVVVVCPSGNLDYRNVVKSQPLARRFSDLGTVEQVVRATLRKPNTFAVVAPEEIIGALRSRGAHSQEMFDWLNYHRLRYGW